MSEHHTNLLLEDMQAKFEAIMEILVPMQQKIERLTHIETELAEVKADVKTMKAVLTSTNIQVHDHEQRLTRLEAQAAR